MRDEGQMNPFGMMNLLVQFIQNFCNTVKCNVPNEISAVRLLNDIKIAKKKNINITNQYLTYHQIV